MMGAAPRSVPTTWAPSSVSVNLDTLWMAMEEHVLVSYTSCVLYASVFKGQDLQQVTYNIKMIFV